ncbi:unnamed protein product, partial [Anisakis simplex]|uniref:Uncharacterized protein n=1 Tax=Anisakis simplex TaxID=6269 RepID=A0A0M3JZ96_ANISI
MSTSPPKQPVVQEPKERRSSLSQMLGRRTSVEDAFKRYQGYTVNGVHQPVSTMQLLLVIIAAVIIASTDGVPPPPPDYEDLGPPPPPPEDLGPPPPPPKNLGSAPLNAAPPPITVTAWP